MFDHGGFDGIRGGVLGGAEEELCGAAGCDGGGGGVGEGCDLGCFVWCERGVGGWMGKGGGKVVCIYYLLIISFPGIKGLWISDNQLRDNYKISLAIFSHPSPSLSLSLSHSPFPFPSPFSVPFKYCRYDLKFTVLAPNKKL